MQPSPTLSIPIQKIISGKATSQTDLIASEEPLEIRVAYRISGKRIVQPVSVTMRTPGNDAELALGFLFSEGIISGTSELTGIETLSENVIQIEFNPGIVPEIKKLDRNFYTTSSCGVCGKSSIDAIKVISAQPEPSLILNFSSELICSLPESLRAEQSVFEKTGGLHASAIFDSSGKLLQLREDVGRHNALDKIIGYYLQSGNLPLPNKILLLSGRASFELIQKAAMAGISVVAAVGAPSSLAVETAKEFNMTLIGFLRDRSFNIYSGELRISE